MKFQIPQFTFDSTVDEKWPEFAEKWSAIIYEDEALGLMHAAASWIGSHKQPFELEIIKFFLFYSSFPPHAGEYSLGKSPERNNYVFKAQELLLGKVIPNWNSLRRSGSEKAHEGLLNLLVKPTQPLIKAPFHKFVASYLWEFQDLVEYGNFYSKHRNAGEETCATQIQPLFELYVMAMVNWELADDLLNMRHPLNFYRANDIQKILERFVQSENIDIEYLFAWMMHSSRGYIQLEKRSGFPNEHDVRACVFIALMGLRYLVNKEPIVRSRPGLFD